MIRKCKKILLDYGITEYIVSQFEQLEGVNLIGVNVEEILSMSSFLLQGFTEDTLYAIKTQKNREIIAEFAKKYPNLFKKKPYSSESVAFLEEFLCEGYLQLTEEECAQALEYIEFFCLEIEEYPYYKYYLFMRNILKEDLKISLPIQIREHDDYTTTYDLAEKYIDWLEKSERRKYEIP